MKNNNTRKPSELSTANIDEISVHQEFTRKKKLGLKQTFAALRFPNYRLWFWGQMTSLFGSWMQTTAQGFLIYELTRSPVYLGYVGFAAGIPAWLFMIYGGVIADRFSIRNILLVTQSIMMIQALILAFLTFTGLIQPWHIILLAFFLGTANAFDAPSRQAFVYELVDREYLTNAIALNSTMFNTATASGPAIAGITYALFGAEWCFTINGISFLGVIIPLLKMELKPQLIKEKKQSTFSELKDGLKYILNQKIIFIIILIIIMISIFGLGLITLFPAWAVKILNGDATTNGFMQSARGLGALLSALFIATVSSFIYKGRLLTIGTLILPILIFIFSFIRWIPLALVFLIAVGASLILIFNIANASIQSIVSQEFRGRVMGVYSFSFFGFMPIGSLMIGTMAEHFGEPVAVIINSIVLFIFAIILYLKIPSLRVLK